jgi:hypothetical protein
LRYEPRIQVRTRGGAEIKGTMDGSGIYIILSINSKTTRKKKKTSFCWLKHASISRFPYTKHPSMTNYPVIGEPKCTLAAHANLGVLGSSSQIWLKIFGSVKPPG